MTVTRRSQPSRTGQLLNSRFQGLMRILLELRPQPRWIGGAGSLCLLTGFDHVGDQRVAVSAVLANPVGRVGAVHKGDQCDQSHYGDE
jgi:hypothetical protein